MTIAIREKKQSPIHQGLPPETWKEGRVYAIAFDLDIEQLRTNGTLLEIRRILQRHGFTWQQGSVYFGGPEVNSVTCVLAAMDLARTLTLLAHPQ